MFFVAEQYAEGLREHSCACIKCSRRRPIKRCFCINRMRCKHAAESCATGPDLANRLRLSDALAQTVDVFALAAHAEVRALGVGALFQHLAVFEQLAAQLLC